MVFPKARLVVSGVLFLSWIGFLLYLVLRTRDPVILSRPQFLVAPLQLIAQVDEKDGKASATVTVESVGYAADPEDEKLAGKQIVVEGLPDCGPRQGWAGAGSYLLPLTKEKVGRSHVFLVTPLPISPGYSPQLGTVILDGVGKNKDKVAELVARYTGRNEVPAKAMDKGVLRRNVLWPREEEDLDKHKNFPEGTVQEMVLTLREAGAQALARKEETRIYRANQEALEQWEEIKPRK